MESLSFQYPSWYILLCVLLGAIFAVILYYRDKTFAEQSTWLVRILTVLRFVTITLLAILLLSPLLKSIISEIKKPVIVIVQDQSESVDAALSQSQADQYKDEFNALSRELSGEYEVREYAFGSEVREEVDFSFSDKESNISEALHAVYDLYSNQNLGAILLATDGIYNEGNNPLYTNIKLNAPVFTIALGDTTPKKDLLIKRVFHNKIVYLGDKFSIQIDVAAVNCTGSNSTLTIQKIEGENFRTLQQIPVIIDKNDFFMTKEVILDAEKSGIQRYRIQLSTVQGEATTVNNVREIFIDVLDARQKILLLANAPHPDLAAMKQAIEFSKNYEVIVAMIADFKGSLTDFDFVVLHQLPSRTNPISDLLQRMDTRKMPRWYVVGNQSDFARINQIQPFVEIKSDGRNSNEVQATLSPGFNYFTISDLLRQELPKFVPLTATFGEYREVGNGQTLLYQRIGKVDTKYPLLTVGESGGIRAGVLVAEGIYRWRLFDYLQHQNHDIFNEFVGKTVQYLSIKEDKRKFRVTLLKNIFNENEPIIVDAELYNENLELINEPDAVLTIKNKDGKEFPFTFNKSGKTYHLNAGIFPVGDYTFSSTVSSAGQQLSFNGQFSVQPVQLESYETTANHSLLRQLSLQTGGEMLYSGDLAKVTELLKKKNTVRPVMYSTSKTRSVINLKWIFFLLLGLLTSEWFLRRYFGAY